MDNGSYQKLLERTNGLTNNSTNENDGRINLPNKYKSTILRRKSLDLKDGIQDIAKLNCNSNIFDSPAITIPI